ncbi:transposase [Trichonephila clavipes]|uniref:Transposase n=1 Tax=Trichonephila clavipes TaxID=2585209 RepID=A0A8X6VFW2_TRICX|nr:transposase [Trichonephila clavipes]
MASIFWDAYGILFIDYLEKGKILNSEYYTVLLDQLNEKIKKKRPQMQKKKVMYLEDNAPCHKSMKTMVKLNELCLNYFPTTVQFSSGVTYTPQLPHHGGRVLRGPKPD